VCKDVTHKKTLKYANKLKCAQAVASKNSHVVVKISFEVLEKGDVALFQRTLATHEELSRTRRASR
jgi:hypothetical protein